LIQIVPKDKKHAESALCEGSICYISEANTIRILNVFSEFAEQFGLAFIPNADYGMYYVDPCDKKCYISLENSSTG